MPTLDKHDLLLICVSLVFLGLTAVAIAAGMRARSAAVAARAALLMLAVLLAIAVLGFALPMSVSEALLVVFAAVVWISRWPYLIGKARLGKVLVTIPDQTGPQFTVPAGVLMAIVGLLWMAGEPFGARFAILPYLGLSLISLGVVEGLNFLFPAQVGEGGILDPYGGLSRWEDIESYAWSADGELLELNLRQSPISRRRYLAVPPRFHEDVAAYLSHRLWDAPAATVEAGASTRDVPPGTQEAAQFPQPFSDGL